MKISRATINAIVFSCRATQSGKGYMLLCAQDGNPFTVFSKTAVPVGTDLKELTVDINCYVDKKSGEFKEFVSTVD